MARQNDLGDDLGTILNNLAEQALFRSEFDTARQLFSESLAVYKANQNLWGTASVLEGLAGVDVHKGDLPAAADLMRECLALDRRRKDRVRICLDLVLMANIAALQAQPERAVRLAGAAESIRLSLGLTMMTPAQVFENRQAIESNIQRAKDALGPAAGAEAWEQGTRMTIDQAVEYATHPEIERPEAAPLSS